MKAEFSHAPHLPVGMLVLVPENELERVALYAFVQHGAHRGGMTLNVQGYTINISAEKLEGVSIGWAIEQEKRDDGHTFEVSDIS